MIEASVGPGCLTGWDRLLAAPGLDQLCALAAQRALLRELGELEAALPSVRAPVLVLADPGDAVVPFETARRLVFALSDARLQLVCGAGHQLPRRAPQAVADAIVAFLAAAQVTDVPVTQPG